MSAVSVIDTTSSYKQTKRQQRNPGNHILFKTSLNVLNMQYIILSILLSCFFPCFIAFSINLSNKHVFFQQKIEVASSSTTYPYISSGYAQVYQGNTINCDFLSNTDYILLNTCIRVTNSSSTIIQYGKLVITNYATYSNVVAHYYTTKCTGIPLVSSYTFNANLTLGECYPAAPYHGSILQVSSVQNIPSIENDQNTINIHSYTSVSSCLSNSISNITYGSNIISNACVISSSPSKQSSIYTCNSTSITITSYNSVNCTGKASISHYPVSTSTCSKYSTGSNQGPLASGYKRYFCTPAPPIKTYPTVLRNYLEFTLNSSINNKILATEYYLLNTCFAGSFVGGNSLIYPYTQTIVSQNATYIQATNEYFTNAQCQGTPSNYISNGGFISTLTSTIGYSVSNPQSIATYIPQATSGTLTIRMYNTSSNCATGIGKPLYAENIATNTCFQVSANYSAKYFCNSTSFTVSEYSGIACQGKSLNSVKSLSLSYCSYFQSASTFGSYIPASGYHTYGCAFSSITNTPTITPSSSRSPTFKSSSTSRPSTAIPTLTPSFLKSSSPTFYPTAYVTSVPSLNPSSNPSSNPISVPTYSPSCNPSSIPTNIPISVNPTANPTSSPTNVPIQYTATPSTGYPSTKPSRNPTRNPNLSTSLPTASLQPSSITTTSPTGIPISLRPTTAIPSCIPSSKPTAIPQSSNPSSIPSYIPTDSPSSLLTSTPSSFPSSIQPSSSVTINPTLLPSSNPTFVPTFKPSSNQPTLTPTNLPVTRSAPSPTAIPSKSPISIPTFRPSCNPSSIPSPFPVTSKPSVYPSAYPSAIPFQYTASPTTSTPSSLSTNTPSDPPNTANTGLPTTTSTSKSPTYLPSIYPSSVPISLSPTTLTPTCIPTSNPSNIPLSANPSNLPSFIPTDIPSNLPISNPTNPNDAVSKTNTLQFALGFGITSSILVVGVIGFGLFIFVKWYLIPPVSTTSTMNVVTSPLEDVYKVEENFDGNMRDTLNKSFD